MSSSILSSGTISGSGIAYDLPDGTPLFEELQFSFGPQIYGLVGSNGVGKTTFLKLLKGDLEPSRGRISVRGSISYCSQIADGPSLPTGVQTVEEILGIQKIRDVSEQEEYKAWEFRERLGELFRKLKMEDLQLERLCSSLSGGERVKVLLAKVLLESSDIILLDEPTNHLDSRARKVFYDWLGNANEISGKCLIVSSHDRTLLSLVNKTAELTDRGLQLYGGNIEFYQVERRKEEERWNQKMDHARTEKNRQKKDLQKSIERQNRRMQRAKNKASQGGIPKVLANILKEKSQNSAAKLKSLHEDRYSRACRDVRALKEQGREQKSLQLEIPRTSVHSKKEILFLRDFNFRYFGASRFLFSKPISFHIAGPKRVCISGGNGAGKSSLLKILRDDSQTPLGEIHGEISLKTNRVAYLDQGLEILGDLRNTVLKHFSTQTPHLTMDQRIVLLRRFQFTAACTEKKMSVLSGGEKMRAALACVFFREVAPELLILDEPTNNLDLEAIGQLETALSYFTGAILVVSHDLKFLENIGVTEEISLEMASRLVDG